jgi:RNA polymerase sigma-70 factor (ECF subfamily)
LELHLHQPPVSAISAEVNSADALDVAELTRRMAAGEEAAYRIFYEAYYDRLSRYLLVVTAGDEEAALEALQSALVRVVRHVKVFRSEAVFWSWLTVLARTALSDQNRKRRRYLAFLDRFSWQARIEPSEPEDTEADARLLSLLQRNLAALPADEKQLVEGKYLEGRSVRELAGELQTSEKAVESRLVRVRRKLREALLLGLKNE